MGKKRVRKYYTLLMTGFFLLLGVIAMGSISLGLPEESIFLIENILYIQFIFILFMGFFLVMIGRRLLGRKEDSVIFVFTALTLVISMISFLLNIEYGYKRVYNPNVYDNIIFLEVTTLIRNFLLALILIYVLISFVFSFIYFYKQFKKQVDNKLVKSKTNNLDGSSLLEKDLK